MFTLKVIFKNNGKIYHYASMKCMGRDGDTCRVAVTGHGPQTDYQEVIIVGHDVGISDNATRWRTGSSVTDVQRLQFPQLIDKKEKVMDKVNITLEEVQQACDTFKRMSCSKNIKSIGLSVNGNIYYQEAGGYSQQMTIDPDTYQIKKLLNIVNESERKLELQNSLNQLLKKVEEIKSQINNF